MRKFGLIGSSLKHSFSYKYFNNKFRSESISSCSYDNFEIKTIDELGPLVKSLPELIGLNVTIPFKESVIPFLNELDPLAIAIGAVNTIKINYEEEEIVTIGYNTDSAAFGKTLEPLLDKVHKNALVLGTGGAAKAVSHALSNLKIKHLMVSRNHQMTSTLPVEVLNYADLEDTIIKSHQLIINTTPLGMHPNQETCPDIPYGSLTEKHLLYDLVYNPEESLFLSRGKEKGSLIKNGKEMLEVQAELSWELWNASSMHK